MANVLKNLKPQNVFEYFEAISSIPRGSGNEKAISDYMIKFAKEQGLWAVQDEAYNVYIKKPASTGYEHVPPVILQGHMDMVCEKNKDVRHDFEKDALKLSVDGDYIRALGTTLGADNGVAIAYQMAVLADKQIKHPSLEILMTTDEERGMNGASNIHPEYLEGRMLINLDTDVEGEFLVSCAGGVKTSIDLKLDYAADSKYQERYRITVSGLQGGHSGADIHFERANAHIIMGRVLDLLRRSIDFNLCELNGGGKDNVITRECECVIALEPSEVSLLKQLIITCHTVIQKEYSIQDPLISITTNKESEKPAVYSKKMTNDIIDLLILIPNGIIGYSQSMKGLVETSLNLGIVGEYEGSFRFGSAIRSSVPSRKQELVNKLEVLSRRFDASFSLSGDYPAWEYCDKSSLRELAVSVYQEMYGCSPDIKSIHAGLECGFIAQKLLGIDMIAFGPNVSDIHSPNERVSISSMARVYEYLIKLLEKITSY